MADPIVVSNWALGLDNRTRRDKLQPMTVRDIVNLDAGESLTLRPGYQRVYTPGGSVRGALALKSKVLIADGTDLVELDTLTNSTRVLAQIVGVGPLAGAVFNEELYFSTANQCLRYDGNNLREWGVPTVNQQPFVSHVAGAGFQVGTYFVAVTVQDSTGAEGGTTAARLVTGVTGMDVQLAGLPTPPPGGRVCIYVSPVNSTTLYLYAYTTSSTFVLSGTVRDNQATLSTQFETPPMPSTIVVAHTGCLLLASGKYVWMTQPLRPHAVSRSRGFFPFPKNVNALVPVEGGVYVGADATYFLSGLYGDQPTLRKVYDTPIQAGSAVRRDNGSAVWLSADGYMGGSATGAVSPLTADRFVPLLADTGASAVLRYDGKETMVTTMQGAPKANPLGASDFFQSEIIRHE